MMKKAVIYARYSSARQRDVSIEQQVEACERYAEQNDIAVLKVYDDRAMTGTNDKRPSFRRMINDADGAGWDYVIVYALDRFARDRYDSAVYKKALKECGVSVLSATENISEEPSGVLLESMLEGMAEYYSRELSVKIRRGLNDNAKKGLVTNGSLPYGYKAVNGHYVIDEPKAALVREVFERVSCGELYKSIVDDINNRGIPTQRGKKWTHESIRRMISNERYTGTYVYDRIKVENGIPAIVDKTTFEICNSRAGAHLYGPHRHKGRELYQLTGKVFCGLCGEPMSGSSAKDFAYSYYTCHGHKVLHNCDKHNEPKEKLEQAVCEAICKYALTDECIEEIVRQSTLIRPKNDLDLIAEKVAECKKNADAMVKIAIALGEDGATLMAQEIRDTKAALLEAEAEYHRANKENLYTLTEEQLRQFLLMYRDGDIEDRKYRQALIDAFLIRVLVYDDKLDIYLNTDPEHPVAWSLDLVPSSPPNIQYPNCYAQGRRYYLVVRIEK